MAFRFAQSPSHSCLRTFEPPDWHATNYFTLSAWVRCNGGNQDQTVVWLQHALGSGDALNWYVLWLKIYNGQIWPTWRVTTENSNYDLESTHSWSYLDTDWHHIIVWANRPNDSIHMSVDNNTVENLESVKFPGTAIDKLLISASGLYYNAMIGDIAEVAPWTVWPHGCIGYWPLIRELHDLAGGHYLTAYEDPDVSEHVPLAR